MLLEEVMTLGCFFCQVEHFVELHKPVSKLTDCFEAGDLIQRRDQILEKKKILAEKAEKANLLSGYLGVLFKKILPSGHLILYGCRSPALDRNPRGPNPQNI
jgi:hypothetical protein